MSDRSVITLQVGHYANHIGAHFWNIQESLAYNNAQREINHDVLFREGLTPNTQEVTYLPRLVLVDLKGSLGLLPEYGDLYDDGINVAGTSKSQLAALSDTFWSGKVEVQKEESKRKNDFLLSLEREENAGHRKTIMDEDKDVCEGNGTSEETKKIFSLQVEEVKVWSDYLRMRYHPKTNLILQEYQNGNTTRPFDIYGLGIEEAKSTSEEYEDRVRFFAEECDYLAGFQVLVDSDNAFGGYGTEMLRYLSDDYGSKSVAVFPCVPADVSGEPHQNLGRFLNTALALHSLSSEANIVTPLSLAADTFPLRNSSRALEGLQYRPDLAYHTSAILAGTLDSLTLPWRLSSSGARHSMLDVVSGLNVHGRKIANAACAMPFPSSRHKFDSIAEMLPNISPEDTFGLVSLTPSTDYIKEEIWMQSLSVRGMENHLKPASYNLSDPRWQKEYSKNVYLRADSLNQALLCHFSEHWPSTKVGVTSATSALPVSTPFPRIFTEKTHDSTVPILTSWNSSRGSGTMVSKMSERMSKLNLNKLHRFQETGLESDEVVEVLEDLYTLAKCYEPDSLC